MLILLGGAVVGPFVGVSMFMLALQNCHVGVVTTILATIPVMILPFSVYLYGERVSLRAIGGALVAVAGVALLMLPVHTPPPQAARPRRTRHRRAKSCNVHWDDREAQARASQ